MCCSVADNNALCALKLQFELSMMSKRMLHLEKQKQQLEVEQQQTQDSNQQLQDLVAQLQTKLQGVELERSSICQQQRQHAVIDNDLAAAAQAALKPVAVSSSNSHGSESQPDEPGTPELTDTSCSCSSSNQSSRRSSEVDPSNSPHGCSSRGSAAGTDYNRINVFHPLHKYWSWV